VVGLPYEVNDLGLEGGLNLSLMMAFSNAQWDNATGATPVGQRQWGNDRLRPIFRDSGQQVPLTGACQ